MIDKVLRGHPEMDGHTDEILESVAQPDHRERDPYGKATRERYFKSGVGPRRWLRVVVEYEGEVDSDRLRSGPRPKMTATVRIGQHEFDYIDWDEPQDVLYLAKGGPREVAGLHASPEGHHLRIDASGSLQGVTLVGPLGILEHDRRVPVSMPDGRPIGDAEVAEVVLSSARG